MNISEPNQQPGTDPAVQTNVIEANQQQERAGIIRRSTAAVLVAAAAMTGAGCNVEYQQSRADADVIQDVPSSPIGDLKKATLISDIIANSPDIEDVDAAREELPTLGGLAQETFGQVLADEIDKADAETALFELSVSQIEPEAAREKLADIKDRKIKVKAQAAVDAQHAVEIMDDYQYSSMDYEEAIKALDAISSDAVRKQLEKTINAIRADEIVSGVRYSYDDIKTARDEIEKLDEETRERATAVLDAYERDPYQTSLSDTLYEESDKLDALHDARTEALQKINDEHEDWRRDLEDQIDADEVLIERLAREYAVKINSLQRERAPSFDSARLSQQNATMNLGGIKNGETVIDSEATHDGYTTETRQVEYEQFASIVASEGKLVLQYPEGATIPQDVKKQLQQLYDELYPLLHASFANGDLVTVRFVLGDDYDPYFLRDSKEVYMVLPKRDTIPYEQVRSGLTHENFHAMASESLESGDSLEQHEEDQIEQVCWNVRGVALGQLQIFVSDMSDTLGSIIEQAKPEHKAMFQQLKRSIDKGDLAEVVAPYDLEGDEFTYILNECLDAVNFESMLGELHARSTDYNAYQTEIDIQYLAETEAYQALRDEWRHAVRAFTIYAKFNEANYVQARPDDQQYLGHTEDNVDEMIASILDASVNYPDAFGETLAAMPPDEREAAVQAIQLAGDLVVKNHPEFLGPLAKIEARVLAGLNK